ncbi:unnamed protein product [Blepharisma stoltei]|uniref:Uncharacterized protein n=1 Tax=Blepharisma stoltei TaxID=1481888 RepID=A0AAU9IE52_9CILI|nr:unnamed protein product [Blepharisma stoltei]
MLSRLSRNFLPSVRSFSGSDPYWLNLKQQHDNYPQYAHLHWHTFDPLEIGKYAKYRSKELYGDHVSEDPTPITWYPEVDELTTLTKEQRDLVYDLYRKKSNDFLRYLELTEDLDVGREGKTLYDGVNEKLLHILKPAQVKESLKYAKKVVADFKAAGATVTKEYVIEKVLEHFLTTFSKHQVHELQHELEPYLKSYGPGCLTD